MASEVGKARDLYDQANREWARGELTSAFKHFLEAARAGEKHAYRTVADFYDVGDGTPRDEERALRWYRRAYHECADRSAANNIACIMRDRGEMHKALWWFWRAIKLGDGDAQLNLAKYYLQLHDPGKARRHLKRLVASQEASRESLEEAEQLLAEMS